jgi:SAM-dependent methyltransferase
MTRPEIAAWDTRFAGDDYVFGTEPNAFLTRAAHRISAGGRVLVVADGEGRNGVWLASQRLAVHATEGSPAAIAKSVRLAAERDVPVAASASDLLPGAIVHERVDLLDWAWPIGEYDAVVAIFIQFARPDEREFLFAGMAGALKPGGVLLLEGYHQRQLQYATGGPRVLDQLYDQELLLSSFPRLDIDSIADYDVSIDEGPGHRGTSAVIDLIASRPAHEPIA